MTGTLLRVVLNRRLVLVAYYGFALLLLRWLQFHRLLDGSSSLLSSLSFLAIVVGMEGAYTWWHEMDRGRRDPRSGTLRWFRRAGLLFRIGAWATAVWLLVEYPARLHPGSWDLPERGLAPHVWDYVYLVAVRSPVVATAFGALWLVLVELVVIRRRVLRGVLTMLLPAGMFLFLVVKPYLGVGENLDASAVSRQDDVDVVFDAGKYVHEPLLRDMWNYSRALVVDRDNRYAVAAFGASLGDLDILEEGNVWVIDLEEGRFSTLPVPKTRVLVPAYTGASVYVLPYPVRRNKGEVIRLEPAIPVRHERASMSGIVETYSEPEPIVEPDDVVILGRHAYVSFSVAPDVYRFDRETGRFQDRLGLSVKGYLRPGEMCCHMHAVDRDGTLLIMASQIDGGVLFVVDSERMEVEREIRLPALPFTVSAFPAAPRYAYVSAEFRDELWRVDLETGAVADTCSAPPGAILKYDPYRDRIVLLDRWGGTASHLTPDCVVEKTWFVGRKPGAVHATDRGFYVLSSAGVVFVDTRDL